VDRQRKAIERGDLGLDLVWRAEDMAVVLDEAAHAHDAVQCAGGLVAVAEPELAIAKRQIAVAAQIRVEDLDVPRTVHRLDREVTLLRLRGEHVLLVVLPVSRALPQAAIEDHRTAHFLVAVIAVNLAHVLLDLLPDGPPLRMPEDHARRL